MSIIPFRIETLISGFIHLLWLTLLALCLLGDSYQWVPNKIDRDHLFLPEVLIENPDVKVDETLRIVYDMIWNSAGWPKSLE